MTRNLYLCYFGLREPLVQTQVLPYLRELVSGGVEVSLLTFEPEQRRRWSPETVRDWQERLRGDGIRWHALPYHKRPSLPATLYDIAAGGWFAAQLARREGIDVLHARSHVAAAMGALGRRWSGARLLFDIRGFNPEEYVDAGVWSKNSLNYRLTKRAEQSLLAAADGFVVLTARARDILFPGCVDTDPRGRPVEVIPCCVDLERFRAADALPREEIRKELGVTGRRVLVYVGALGGFYLTGETAGFLAAACEQDPSTFSMILTQSPPELIEEPLRRLGVPAADTLVRRVSPAEIPRFLRAADLAVSFIKPSYSKLASSPTKIAEYLASGLPVICNTGIGDVDRTIEEDRVGVLLPRLDPPAYREALRQAEILRQEPGISDRCRESAARRFDLSTVGGARYRRLYQRLLEDRPAGARDIGAAL